MAEMELANAHMARMLGEIQERLFAEDKVLSREKALARIRAKIPEPQKKLEGREWTKVAKKKGKEGSVQHLGEAKDAEQLIDEEEDELAYDKDRDARALALDDRGEGKHGRKD